MQLSPSSNSRTCITPRRNSICISSCFPVSPSPAALGNHIYLLSLWICLFWRSHTNGVIQYVALCLAPFTQRNYFYYCGKIHIISNLPFLCVEFSSIKGTVVRSSPPSSSRTISLFPQKNTVPEHHIFKVRHSYCSFLWLTLTPLYRHNTVWLSIHQLINGPFPFFGYYE